MPVLNSLEKKKAHAAHLLSLGKTQQEAADVVGVSRETINRWKRDDPFFASVINSDDIGTKLQKNSELAKKLKKASIDELDVAIYQIYGLVADAVGVMSRLMRDPEVSHKVQFECAKFICDYVKPQQKQAPQMAFFSGPMNQEVLGEAVKMLVADESVEVIDDAKE